MQKRDMESTWLKKNIFMHEWNYHTGVDTDTFNHNLGGDVYSVLS